MKIGELAKRTGFSPKTIRYYESRGLLGEPERTASGYRSYAESDVERLEFIEKAKRLGFSLEEVRDVLVLSEQQRPCEHVIALIDEKLIKLDDVLSDLKAFRSRLARLRQESAEQLERLPADARVRSQWGGRLIKGSGRRTIHVVARRGSPDAPLSNVLAQAIGLPVSPNS